MSRDRRVLSHIKVALKRREICEEGWNWIASSLSLIVSFWQPLIALSHKQYNYLDIVVSYKILPVILSTAKYETAIQVTGYSFALLPQLG